MQNDVRPPITELVRTTKASKPVRAVFVGLPPRLVLGTIVALAAVLHAALALSSPSIWIVPDELIYSELAKSLGDGGLPRIRGEVSFAYGLGYPLLLAPLWAVFDDVPSAYTAAKIVNAFVLSLTAVPAYLLARRFLERGGALLVAALTVSVPAMLYAGTLMTEVALYPTVVLALFAISRALEAPRAATEFGALGAIALACSIKTIAVVLLPAYAGSAVLFAWLETRDRRELVARLGRYRVTAIALVLAVAAATALAMISGRPQGALGSYAAVIDHLELAETPRWILLHLAELDLAVAVIPLAASLIVVARGFRRESRSADRLYSALVVPALTAWLVAVGAFASVPFLDLFEYPENVTRLQGRSTFVLAPLLFVGLAMWLARRESNSLALCIVAACAVLPALIPLHRLTNVGFQSFSLAPWANIQEEVPWPGGVLIVGGSLAACFVTVARTRASALSLAVPILAIFAVVTLVAHSGMRRASEWTLSAGAARNSPDWIDRGLPRGSEASVVWYEPVAERAFVDLAPRHFGLFIGEFFNRRVGDVFVIGARIPYRLPSTPVALEGTRLVGADGTAPDLGDFVLVPCHVSIRGELIARDAASGARVVRVSFPLEVAVRAPPCP